MLLYTSCNTASAFAQAWRTLGSGSFRREIIAATEGGGGGGILFRFRKTHKSGGEKPQVSEPGTTNLNKCVPD